jgi:hypothetical protein
MASSALAARTEARRQSRALLRRREDAALHLARVHAALQLEGVEPVQGALADLFACFGEQAAGLKQAALQLAANRLDERKRRRFEAWVAAPRLPRNTPLATRWSLLARPSADISTRARRCSADDSRALAGLAIAACEAGDLAAQELFFHHCLSCDDRLAFMLVRRELNRRGAAYPPGWSAVERTLQAQGALA